MLRGGDSRKCSAKCDHQQRRHIFHWRFSCCLRIGSRVNLTVVSAPLLTVTRCFIPQFLARSSIPIGSVSALSLRQFVFSGVEIFDHEPALFIRRGVSVARVKGRIFIICPRLFQLEWPELEFANLRVIGRQQSLPVRESFREVTDEDSNTGDLLALSDLKSAFYFHAVSLDAFDL